MTHACAYTDQRIRLYVRIVAALSFLVVPPVVRNANGSSRQKDQHGFRLIYSSAWLGNAWALCGLRLVCCDLSGTHT